MDNKQAFLVDSGLAANLEIFKENKNLFLIPLYIIINENEAKKDIQETSTSSLYEYFEKDYNMKTSQASVIDYENIYKEITNKGYTDLFVFCMSSKLSGTINNATLAKENIKGINIHIIDTKCISSIGVNIVKDIMDYTKKNRLNTQEIINFSQKMFAKVKIFFFVDSLKYLQKGGRVSLTKAKIADFLNIKPILKIEDGIIKQIATERTLTKTIKRICAEIAKESYRKIYLFNSEKLNMYDNYKEKVADFLNLDNMNYMELNSVILTHTGPYIGAIAALDK